MKVHKGEELTIYGQSKEWTCVECGKPQPTDYLSYCATCNESHCTSCMKIKIVTKTLETIFGDFVNIRCLCTVLF